MLNYLLGRLFLSLWRLGVLVVQVLGGITQLIIDVGKGGYFGCVKALGAHRLHCLDGLFQPGTATPHEALGRNCLDRKDVGRCGLPRGLVLELNFTVPTRTLNAERVVFVRACPWDGHAVELLQQAIVVAA
eukprot:3798892-Lingulodinium_polyedra.AAC.1